jgi:methionyl-tRNA formyltransferase
MHIDKSIYVNKPGSIIDITSEGITFKTIDYAIVITYLQFPNKKIITSQDAVNSYLDFFTN